MEKNESLKKAKELRNGGLTLKKIGKILGVSDVTVWNWLKNDPEEIERRIKRKSIINIDNERREESILRARSLRKEGLPFKEIGKRLGVSWATVFYWLKDDPEEIERRVEKNAMNFKD